MLAATFDTATPELSALATAVEAEQDNQSIRTAAELFADAADLATAGRTSTWLDQDILLSTYPILKMATDHLKTCLNHFFALLPMPDSARFRPIQKIISFSASSP